MNSDNFGLKQKIPGQAAFLVVLIFGALVAWFVINTGQKIISGFSQKEILQMQKSSEFLPEDISVQNKSLKK